MTKKHKKLKGKPATKRVIPCKMVAAMIPLCLVVIGGCASFKSEVLPIENPTVTVMLHNNVKFDNPRVKGDAKWWYVGKQKYCLIRLREYPNLLGHEMRHCFEGYWHDERPNGEDY